MTFTLRAPSLPRRRLLQTLALAATFSAARAWPQAAASASGPVRGGTLFAVIFPEPNQLGTAFNNQYANTLVGANIYDGLLTYDDNHQPQPGLAESWAVSPDGLTYTFKLRRNVKWHDGANFTSADVRYTALEVWKKLHSRGRLTFAPLKDVETPDPYTAVFRLEFPAAVILSALNAAESQVVPKHVYEGTDLRKNPAYQRPIGTGPFKFKDWKKGQYIELERNPDYWDKGKPHLDRVIFRIIPDPAGRAAALETGEVQYIPYSGVPFADVARLRRNPAIKLESRGYAYHSQLYFLEFNVRRPYVDNPAVRRAIAHAVDKQGLINTVWYGLSKPVDSPIPPSLGRYYNPNIPRYPYDPAKAEQLLDQAGLPRKSDGVRFAINLDLSPSSSSFPLAGEYLRQALQRVGIAVKPILSDQPTYLRKVYTDYNFDVLLQPYSPLLDPELGLTRLLWSKAAKPGVPYVNASGYVNPELDRVIEAYQREGDAQKRVQQFHALQRIVLTDLPLVPLMEAPFFSLYNSRLQGLNVKPDGVLSSLKDAWLTPARGAR